MQQTTDSKMAKPKNPRRAAREFAVQTLYTYLLAPLNLEKLLVSFATEHAFEGVDLEYWRELVTHGVQDAATLDSAMQPFLSRSIEALNPVEHAVLRVTFYELTARLDVPYRVVINEGVELAKVFGAADSHRFINGVLDAAAKKIRSVEVAQKTKRS